MGLLSPAVAVRVRCGFVGEIRQEKGCLCALRPTRKLERDTICDSRAARRHVTHGFAGYIDRQASRLAAADQSAVGCNRTRDSIRLMPFGSTYSRCRLGMLR